MAKAEDARFKLTHANRVRTSTRQDVQGLSLHRRNPDRMGRAAVTGRIRFRLGVLLVGLFAPILFGERLCAEDPVVTPADLPRVPATAPDQAIATFRIQPGFRVELVAAEPLVIDPVAMSFDEDGRLFVVEMRDYSERRPERLGRIRRLEDVDGDGRFDRSTVYVDGLPWPTAVLCYGGGVFVGTTPDILFCRDSDGDGVGDQREVVFTGFAADYAPYETNKLNVQALLNSFQWGIDNRIHGAASLSGGKVICPKHSERPAVELRGRDFSFDPRTLDFRAETGGGQHGMSFDDAGRKFVCHNSSHAQTLMYEERYVGRNPRYAPPRALVDIAADGPAAEVFRLSPDEPWRVIRTRWRVAGLVPGPVEGGGRASGYFTAATGITVYRGDAFPESFRGCLFVADCGSNLIHRKRIESNGVELIARRPPGEEKREFLASTDNWFRPVQMANAPDGTLYVADMYRETIEHPWSLPKPLKEQIDLNSGNDRGRIYRIVPEDHRQRPLMRLSQATTEQLVQTLAHNNGWHRDTASRLLMERGGTNVAAALSRFARESGKPLGRMLALQSLSSLALLDSTEIAIALRDGDPVVRRQAIRLCETYLTAGSTRMQGLTEALSKLAEDSDELVRYQLAWTLGMVPTPGRPALLARILKQSPDSTWMQAAVLNSLGEGAGEFFAAFATDSSSSRSGIEFLGRLAGLIASGGNEAELDNTLAFLRRRSTEPGSLYLLARLLNGASDTTLKTRIRQDAAEFANRAHELLKNPEAPESLRLEAAELASELAPNWAPEVFGNLLQAAQFESLQSAAVRGLLKPSGPEGTRRVLAGWDPLGPSVRSGAIELILRRPDRTLATLEAVREGRIGKSELSVAQVEALRRHNDPAVRDTARAIFGDRNSGRRQEVVRAFEPALTLTGDTTRGRLLFRDRCASCHRLGGEGHAVGPDLVSVRASGPELLLGNILDPNREVAPRYVQYTVETDDSETISGLIATESSINITLRAANGVETVVSRSHVRRFRGSNESMMPEGLETGWKPQDLADLIRFVLTAE